MVVQKSEILKETLSPSRDVIVITPFFGKWKPLVLVFPRYGSTSSTQSVIEESEDSLGEALGVSLGLELGDELGSFL